MLILKSFIRKRTTKTYFMIYTLILSALFLLFYVHYSLDEKENDLYYGSFIEIKDEDISKVKDIKEIKEIKKAIKISEFNDTQYYFLYNPDYNLVNNRIIISNDYGEDIIINEVLDIEGDNKTYQFIVDRFNNEKNSLNKIYVSKEMYNEMLKKNEKETNLIILNRWKRQYNDVMYRLNKIFDPSNVRPFLCAGDSRYEAFITISYVFIWVLIVLFGIVLVITCFNIIQDEEKKNNIYYRIGYRKITLKIFNLMKIFLLILLSIIMAGIIFIILYLFILCLF